MRVLGQVSPNWRAVLAGLLALALAACGVLVGVGIKPGVSTRADLESRWGKPDEVFAEPDGSQRLSYPTGPDGLQTYMATVSPDGVVREVEQVLGPAHFGTIQRGYWTKKEVRRLLGRPASIDAYPMESGHEIWTWNFASAVFGNARAHFFVRFNATGQVVRTWEMLERRPLGDTD